MAEKRYYWLKLKQDFFKDKAIKKLRKIAGGDTYTIIYLKLMLLSLNENGHLFYEGVEETFYEELALEIDEDAENVRVTLAFLYQVGLMEEVSISESALTRIPELVGSETSKAEIMRKKRAREKQRLLESGNNVTTMLPDVTECYTEKREKRKDKDIEIEKEAEKIDYEQIKDLFNDICVSLPSIRILTDKRKKTIKARLKSYTITQLEDVFKMAEASPFLTGKNDRGWKADFDWIMNENHLVSILEGKYESRVATINSSQDIISNRVSVVDDWI